MSPLGRGVSPLGQRQWLGTGSWTGCPQWHLGLSLWQGSLFPFGRVNWTGRSWLLNGLDRWLMYCWFAGLLLANAYLPEIRKIYRWPHSIPPPCEANPLRRRVPAIYPHSTKSERGSVWQSSGALFSLIYPLRLAGQIARGGNCLLKIPGQWK